MLKITDEAEALLTELLPENNCDCLLVGLQQSCCGTSLDLSLTSKEPTDHPITINGISVIMDEARQGKKQGYYTIGRKRRTGNYR